MTRTSAAPVALAAIFALAVGDSTFAWAQANGLTAPEQSQQEDTATLVDEAQRSTHAADENIDVLEVMAKSEGGGVKRRHEDLASSLSLLKGNVDTDIDELRKLSTNDWSGLRSTLREDVLALDAQLKLVEPITHVKVP